MAKMMMPAAKPMMPGAKAGKTKAAGAKQQMMARSISQAGAAQKGPLVAPPAAKTMTMTGMSSNKGFGAADDSHCGMAHTSKHR